ncbi:hypothetical protein [Streptomyces lavendulae]
MEPVWTRASWSLAVAGAKKAKQAKKAKAKRKKKAKAKKAARKG